MLLLPKTNRLEGPGVKFKQKSILLDMKMPTSQTVNVEGNRMNFEKTSLPLPIENWFL